MSRMPYAENARTRECDAESGELLSPLDVRPLFLSLSLACSDGSALCS